MANLNSQQWDPNDHKVRSRAMKTPMLAPEEERELTQRYKDEQCNHAREKLILAHQKLVIGMARKFRYSGLPFQDLVNEGNIGLMRACETFDPSRGFRLSTFATYWIFTSIQDFVHRNISVLRLGRSRHERAGLRKLLRQQVTPEDFANGVEGMSGRDLALMSAALGNAGISIHDQPEEGTELGTALADEKTGADQIMDASLVSRRREVLCDVRSELDEREREVVIARFLSDRTQTLRELASRLEISAERVRQIEQSGLESMRRIMERSGMEIADFLTEAV